jgi:hypothetical protein
MMTYFIAAVLAIGFVVLVVACWLAWDEAVRG